FDANGNRTSVTSGGQHCDAANVEQDRLSRFGNRTYEHPASGDRQRKSDGTVAHELEDDELGNLLRVTLNGSTTIDYVIDGLGRRIGKRVDGVLTHRWLYLDGLRPIAEIDAAGNLTEFVYARGLAPEYMIRGGETFRFVKDHLGSVRLVVNAATGDIVQRLDFDAWGRVLTDTAPGLQPFGFAGGHHDPDTGLVRFGARDYDPDTGRWTAKDPLGFAGGDTNLYAYAGGDPVNFVDSAGTSAEDATQADALGPITIHVLGSDCDPPPSRALHILASLIPLYGNFHTIFFDPYATDSDKGWALLGIVLEFGTAGVGAVLTKGVALGRVAGTVSRAPRLLPAARQVEAAFGASVYKHGGLLTTMEHIF